MIFAEEEVAIESASRRENSSPYQDLVSSAQAGSSAAFVELRRIYSARIYRSVLNITKNCDDAEDAAQEAFLRAYVALRSFEGRSSFYSWLTRIAINSALMVLRKPRARLEVPFDQANEVGDKKSVFEFKDAGPDPEYISARRQRYAHVLKAVGRLQPRLREVIEMRMNHDLSVKEIAQTLKISEAAVKSRLLRARVRLSAVCAIANQKADVGGHRGSLPG
jgi:RNA polymerase sigma-70 factor (ECF subfamily)